MNEKILLPLILLPFVGVAMAASENPAELPLLPMPAQLQQTGGQFIVTQSFSVRLDGYTEPRLERAVSRFIAGLSRKTGIPLSQAAANGKTAQLVIHCGKASEKIQELGEDESYRLVVTSSGGRLDAPNPLGVLHGLQTFLQLVRTGSKGFTVPNVVIEDHPRFPWRGLLIDVSRHFIPMEIVERSLDGMEAVKLNVLHLHLSDDQGFRVESKRFPKLQQLSSDGKFYTQEEIKDLIAYARDRGIRVVPEFDMPGHTTSWFVAYPGLASGPGPYRIERKWGVFDPAMDPTRKETYKFLDKFIGEMADLFPDDFFHIGGDEVNGNQWNANPKIREYMRAHGMKDTQALQTYFTQQLEKIVHKHGKIMEGWDEILAPGIPKDVVIQSWRGQEALARAAQLGYRGLLSNGYYLDLAQPASSHYLVDPLAAAQTLSPQEQARILGGEACMWSEMVDPENIESRLWPRLGAIAERLWSPASVRDLDSMDRRLAAVDDDLQWLGVSDRSNRLLMLQRLAGASDTRALQTFSSVLEPVKGYTRSGSGIYESTTPLNRLVDATAPESIVARDFAEAVDRLIKSKSFDDAAGSALERALARWRDNDQQLEPTLQESFLLRETIPLSKELSAVSATGLQAMAYLRRGGAAPAAWRQAQLSFLQQAQQPRAELLDMIAPPVQQLLEATTPE